MRIAEGIAGTESIEFRSQSQWPRGLSRGGCGRSLLGLPVRMPLGAWCESCVLSDSGFCFGLITDPQEF
jgi:hypothetical protein